MGEENMKKLRQLSDLIERIMKVLLVVVFSVMTISCVLQVYTRTVLNTSLSWTEELARFTFIWTNLLGASLCVKYNAHATVTVILDILNQKVRRYVLIAIQLIILAVAYVMIIPGTQFALKVSSSVSPALKWSMGLIYGAVPVTGVLVMLYTLVYLADLVVSQHGEGGKA
jgi:TRAP-type C4-dicarboxylate transport system permease small subunit